MITTTFHNAYGNFSLRRRPLTPHLPLQAWDACDEYLLAEASAHAQIQSAANTLRVLVINDQFGALAIAFAQSGVYSWGDSYTAHRATLDNFTDNQLDTSKLILLPSTQTPTLLPLQKFDLVLWRIPKNIALLQQQMRILATCVNTTTVVFAGGMQKHLPTGTRAILQQLGEVDTLPGRKKARLFFLQPLSLQQRDGHVTTLTADSSGHEPLFIDNYGLQLRAGPNVFSRDTFDIGARFFIEQFAQLPRADRIADLGCGNGILGIIAKQTMPKAQIEFFDESYQAIMAAKNNYDANINCQINSNASQSDAKFHVDDIFANYSGEPFDLILCNPPFHQGHVVGDHIARQMFIQSKQQLCSNGELWVVGNRHLDYQFKLKRLFGNCRQISANAKFVVLAARIM